MSGENMGKAIAVRRNLIYLPVPEAGGDFPLFTEQRRVWLRAKVNRASTSAAAPACDVFEPTKDHFFDVAALAANLHKRLIKRAERHADTPSPGWVSEKPTLKQPGVHRAGVETGKEVASFSISLGAMHGRAG